MENVIVAVIVGAAALFLIRRFYRSFKSKDTVACNCSCSSTCADASTCGPISDSKTDP